MCHDSQETGSTETRGQVEDTRSLGKVDTCMSEERSDGNRVKNRSHIDDVNGFDSQTDLGNAADTGVQGTERGDKGYQLMDVKIKDLRHPTRQCKTMTSEAVMFFQHRKLEKERFKNFLRDFGLTEEEIKPFGNCHFLIVAQKLLLLGRLSDNVPSHISDDVHDALVTALRDQSVHYMRTYPELFEVFVAPQEGP